MSTLKSWRWYGKHDPVSLNDIRQAGVTDIVSSLHHIPYGGLWTSADIATRKATIEENGMHWSVVESIPVHEDIKTRTGKYKEYIENYKQSIINLKANGVKIICYNFMPIMDWTRTDVNLTLNNGAKTLYFDWTAFTAFDLYILMRENAEKDYSHQQIKEAKSYFEGLSKPEIKELTEVLIANLPGTDEKYSLEGFKAVLEKYKNIDASQLKANLLHFLKEIIPVAEKCGVKMCIHPDDPPFTLMGLPRVVSTEKDIDYILNGVPSQSNGLTFCTGSFGVRKDNNLEQIFTRFADKIHFLHLRSTLRDSAGNFHEAPHLQGDVDMYSIMKLVVEEQLRRKKEGRTDSEIPMRPDHGHQMMNDLDKQFYPGYSGIGRLKGLAELTGLEYGIERSLQL